MISIIVPTCNRPQLLSRLVDSIRSNHYLHYEIIIVNDGEAIPPYTLPNDNKIRILQNDSNKGLAYSRSRGAMESKGNYLLFIDDDNVIGEKMLENLCTALDRNPNLIAAGPLTYYFSEPNKVWFAGVNLSLLSSHASFYQPSQKPELLSEGLFFTQNLHNCFMIRKELGEAVGWFDSEVFMGGTEFDLFMRIKKHNEKLSLATVIDAKCFHDIPVISAKSLRSISCESSKRVYYFQRNRGLLIGRYGTLTQKIIFSLFFYPLFMALYAGIFLLHRRFDFLKTHIIATLHGYRYLLRSN